MCKTLLRFQEHYESPKFRNKIFTLNEFKEWYPKSKGTKKFTYYTDWNGFNFPSHILNPFYSGKFKSLSAAEKRILKTFKDKDGKFYVIGTAKGGDIATRQHEIAHALFYLDKQYKADVTSVVNLLSKKDYEKFTDELKYLGYTKQVYVDEIHAYLLSHTNEELIRFFKVSKACFSSKKLIEKMFKDKTEKLDIKT